MRKAGRIDWLILALSLPLGAWMILDGTRKLATGLYTGENTVYELNQETVKPMPRLADMHISKYAENLRSCSSLAR